jgi:Kdo2-lipid IVA lauroyltransferase/acyltransferase
MPSTEQRFLHPRFWPTWVLVFLLYVSAKLPWTVQKLIARVIAAFAFQLARRRRHIVEVNLALCFPEWSDDERRQNVREVVYENVLGLIEIANAYYQDDQNIRETIEVSGLDKLEKAISVGRGVILLGAHYSHLDLGGRMVSLFHPVYAIYRPHNNPLLDAVIRKNRSKFLQGVLARDDIRGIARVLKNGDIFWYPPDQDYGAKHSVFAPFFGIPAATITASSRLARMKNSPVLTISYHRRGGEQKYLLEFEDMDPEYPTGDDVRDATILNATLEALIRKAPTQYMWTHRRFKTGQKKSRKGEIYRRHRRD